MPQRRSEAPFTVRIPDEGEDRPSWIKVGIIAAIGFAIGVAWPRLAGVRLGPNAPGEAARAAAAASAQPTTPPTALAAAPIDVGAGVATAAPSAGPALVVGTAPPKVTVGKGLVTSCRTESGEVLKGSKACGPAPRFDAIAATRLKRLSHCPNVGGADGKLGVIFTLDFARNKVGADVSPSSTVGNLDTFAACVKGGIDAVSLAGIEHDHPRYTLYFPATFSPREGDASALSAATARPHTGEDSKAHTANGAEVNSTDPAAEVVWEVAIVRDSPRSGALVGRLARGTKVQIANGREGWFRVKYGPGFANEGWVYRGAIGR